MPTLLRSAALLAAAAALRIPSRRRPRWLVATACLAFAYQAWAQNEPAGILLIVGTLILVVTTDVKSTER